MYAIIILGCIFYRESIDVSVRQRSAKTQTYYLVTPSTIDIDCQLTSE